MKKLKVAIHQPNYLPYIGYFEKMSCADIFILLDNVQFSKDSYTQRTKIRTKLNDLWLTIPIEKKFHFKLISEILLPNDTRWVKKHQLSFLANYSKTRYFDQNFIDIYYSENIQKIHKFNEFGITYLKDMFKIKTKIIRASDLINCSEIKSTELLIALIDRVGGDCYISGEGGKTYQNERLYAEKNIQLSFHKFVPFEYRQNGSRFKPYLSAIDFLFNVGPGKVCELLLSNWRYELMVADNGSF